MENNLYFAYGSNLSESQMKERCPNYKTVCKARLDNYELCFPKVAKTWENMGVASIIEKAGSYVEGFVYELTNEDFKRMDEKEGGYDRKNISVKNMSTNESLEVITYIAQKNNEAYNKPSFKYINQIIEGAKAHKLSDNYIESLKRHL